MSEWDCEFIDKCSDIKLKESRGYRRVDEDLEDQYEELCTCGGFKCLLKQKYLEEEK